MSLVGKKIVLAASRKLEEMTILIEKQGGTPLIRSLQGTVFLAEKEVEPVLKQVTTEKIDMFIFTTGIGLETLVNVSEKLGVKETFFRVLQNADVASRGYKTLGALKKLGIEPMATDEDGTTNGLMKALSEYDFHEKKVAIQLHGDPAPNLRAFLKEKGATVIPILPYQHIGPDEKIVKLLCEEMVTRKVDAICFTTAVQVRSFFDYGRKNDLYEEIKAAFLDHVLAVAVGKVTAEALRDEGVINYLTPEYERMGAMIMELSKHYKGEQ